MTNLERQCTEQRRTPRPCGPSRDFPIIADDGERALLLVWRGTRPPVQGEILTRCGRRWVVLGRRHGGGTLVAVPEPQSSSRARGWALR